MSNNPVPTFLRSLRANLRAALVNASIVEQLLSEDESAEVMGELKVAVDMVNALVAQASVSSSELRNYIAEAIELGEWPEVEPPSEEE